MGLSGIRSRVFEVILYPEDINHQNALDKIRERYDYVGILHDKDVYNHEEELKNPENKAGEIKKPHYHIVLKFGNARYLKPLSDDLGIEPNYIIKSSNINRNLRYLIHADDKDKYQYSPEEVFGTLLDDFQRAINDRSEDDIFMIMFNLLEGCHHVMSVSELSVYFAQRGYYGQFRRNFAVWSQILKDHNYHCGQVEEGYWWNE